MPTREFATRQLEPFESASVRALLHTATGRAAEGAAAIAEARKARPDAPDAFVAEALLLERAGKADDARAAYVKAIDAGSTIAFAYYRLATLQWRPQADREALSAVEDLLTRAIKLDNRHALSYAYLAEVKSLLGKTEAIGLARRAISLAPAEPHHLLTASRILMRQQEYALALKDAEAALAMARTEDDRRQVQSVLDAIRRAEAARAPTGAESESDRAGESSRATTPVKVAAGSARPRLLTDVKPSYTADAMRMKVEGALFLDADVLEDGTTRSVRVTKCDLRSRLQESTAQDDQNARDQLLRSQFTAGPCTETFGLSDEAVRALGKWRFVPGTRDGVPVQMRVEIEMTFTLR